MRTILYKNLPSLYLAISIAFLTFTLYLPVLQNDFVDWDDPAYVYENNHIRSFSPAFIKWAFTSFHAAFWHPLTWISHALDYAIWGLDPMGHHLSNILLHGLNTFLTVLLAAKLMMIWRARQGQAEGSVFPDERDILIAAGVTGLLFGTHPLHVESVAWVSERKDLLCALFFLLSVMAYLRFAVTSGGAGEGGWRQRYLGRWYLLSLGLFALSLLSKPMAVSLPLVLLVLDWHPLGRVTSGKTFRSLVFEKLPFVVLALASAGVAMVAHRNAMWTVASPLPVRILVAARALTAYIGKMLVPIDLLPLYPYARDPAYYVSFEYAAALLLVIAATYLAVRSSRQDRLWTAVWCYYVVTLLPVLGIVQFGSQSMADRYTYLPSLGPFALIGVVSAWFWEKAGLRTRHVTIIKRIIISSMIILFATMSVLTLKQIAVWNNSISLWSHDIETDPDCPPWIWNSRGLAYEEKGYDDLALADYDKAIALDARNADGVYRNRGMVFMKRGQHDHAVRDFTSAIVLQPEDANLYIDRGIAFLNAKKLQRAIDDFTKAIALNPSHTNAYVHRGMSYKENGQYGRAIEDYTTTIKIDPSCIEAYNNRGVVYKQLHQPEQAQADYDKAIALDPSFYLAYMNRAAVFGMMGRQDMAIKDYTTVISLNPEFIAAYLYRGELRRKTGDIEQAALDFRKACDLGSTEGCSLQLLIVQGRRSK